MPLNDASVEPHGATGAGEGNRSATKKFVGLFVPELMTVESGSDVAAESSNVSVTLVMKFPPPQSDINIVVAPVGPARSMSMSSGDG